MARRVVVPELITEARGYRSKRLIVDLAGNRFTPAALTYWEKGGAEPSQKNVDILCEALGVKYEKISMPIDKVPADSKFFTGKVKSNLTKVKS